MGCYFNIYGFGSRFESSFTFEGSVKYSQDTMDQALKIVKRMQPDLGGTDILQPLKYIYSRPCYRDHPRQLFIFTDGEVRNTKEVLDLVKHHVHSHRCFSFGIGEGASTALITGMAREGSGHAQFITGTDRMQPKGQRALIYAQLKGESSGGSEGTVTVKYSLKDQPVTNQLRFCLKPTEETGLAVHYLAARSLIRSLEQKERLSGSDLFGIRSSIMDKMKRFRNRIVKTSVQTGVSSVYTAFIAINKDSRQTVKGPLLQTRVQTCDPFLQLVSLQKASGCWELDATLADVFGKTEDELTNQKPAQVDGSVWATLLALIWLNGCKIEQQVEWQFVAMKAASWIGSQKGSAAGIVSEISSGCGSVPYTLTLSVHVSSPKPISKLESSCTLDPLVFLHSDHTQATVNLSPGHMFDKDVELFVFYQDTHQPSAIVEAGVTTAPSGSLMRDPVVMISLYPEFPEEVMSSLATQGEFVFVMDRSGSMSNTRIESAKDTLLLLLKSLPMGCYFNIYGFGSRFEFFYPQSVEYNQDTMDQALKRVKEMKADMGGTEILEPLKHIYSQPCYPDHPRQLFIFTDGEVENTKEVLDLVKHHVHSHRCFSFGIGEGASTALITGMAREGSGHAQFITGTDRMQPKVMQSLRFALQPAVVNISVNWTFPDGITVDTLSPPINVLFQGQRALIYAQLKGESSGGSEGTVTVKYNLKDQPVTNQLHFCLKPTEETGQSLWFSYGFELSVTQKKKACFISLSQDDPFLQLVSLQKASGCWELDATLADVFGKTEDELTNQKPAQVDGSVWATLLALIWLYGCKIEQQVEWQFVAMKAASWIGSQKVGDLSQCVCVGNVLLGCHVTKETLGI
ncbi:von Willebrand factor A domain-containing protein 5A [Anabarilius grahami]|uniref:von Willebrand factor A domain-containing protein 5A n=1 Tax=Anabarilius grahami TaxID=495550 RepID=A0A3N0Z2U7_ANAGA|nr:von Willebrand factor A domain-containing protein 5A [Anabarilius grahami]